MDTSLVAHPENSPNEMVEEVDALGNVLRLVSRRDMRANVLWHRAVFVAVQSEVGQILVHRRADTKDVWPGCWDVAVGGVLSPGEEWEAAAIRELSEELGITGVKVELLGTGVYADPNVKLVA
ncbi:MAG: NUDIX domain-containing protein, partial [Actinomycetes bacterium]